MAKQETKNNKRDRSPVAVLNFIIIIQEMKIW